MRILYHVATLPPRMPRAEAISQEIAALQRCFGGDVVYVNPNSQSPVYVPRLLFGFHKLRGLRGREAGVDLHHFYNPDPYPFLYLRALQRPVVFSVTCGVRERHPRVGFLSWMAAVVASDERSLHRLRSWGLQNVFLARPGIDIGRFAHAPVPLRGEVRLMVGSAPWTKRQFTTKGVEALLLAARQAPELRLVFLWRGVLADEIARRVRQMGLESQVTVLNELVDVNQVLAGVHASITLATVSDIVKSYPHSLLDSLAAGKPVLVSRAIPMADYVERTGCGVVVETVSPAGVLAAADVLAHRYDDLERTARKVGRVDFSQERMIDSFRQVYEQVLGTSV